MARLGAHIRSSKERRIMKSMMTGGKNWWRSGTCLKSCPWYGNCEGYGPGNKICSREWAAADAGDPNVLKVARHLFANFDQYNMGDLPDLTGRSSEIRRLRRTLTQLARAERAGPRGAQPDTASSWLVYWKPQQIVKALQHGFLDAAASAQFKRVEPGDRVWVSGKVETGRLATIGYIDVAERITRSAARRRWGSEVYDAPWVIVVKQDAAVPARVVELGSVTRRIRFISRTNDRLTVARGRVNPQQLQTIRRLQSASAAALAELWGGSQQGQKEDRELARALARRASLDVRRTVLMRKEQALVRSRILGGAVVAACGICGKDYPIELLVAAHIKPRAKCSSSERRDIPGNVVLMCRFGCDELFERRIIWIEEEDIRRSKLRFTDTVESYLDKIVGGPCPSWQQNRAKYFRWHASQARGKGV